MKKIVSIIALLGLFAICANAQTYSAQSVTVPVIAGGSNATALTATMDVRKQKDCAISFVTTSTNATITLVKSVDGTTWHDAGGFTANATTPGYTNVSVGGWGYLRISGLNNVGTVAATNTVKYGVKIGAP